MRLTPLALAFVLAACSPAGGGPDAAGPPAIAAWIAATPGAQILDVRTREEFAAGHLQNARLIPWTDPDFAQRAKNELDPTKPLLVYCRSGRRSAEASAALAKLGFKNLRHLDGGILAWSRDGRPLVKPE